MDPRAGFAALFRNILMNDFQNKYLAPQSINANLGVFITLDDFELPWHPSPLNGVQRRMLDRIRGEVARATSSRALCAQATARSFGSNGGI